MEELERGTDIQHSCNESTNRCCAMFPIHSASPLVGWIIQWPYLTFLKVFVFIVISIKLVLMPKFEVLWGGEISSCEGNMDCIEFWLLYSAHKECHHLLHYFPIHKWTHPKCYQIVLQNLLSSPNYSTLHSQNTKTKPKLKKSFHLQEPHFLALRFHLPAPLCHHVVDKVLW